MKINTKYLQSVMERRGISTAKLADMTGKKEAWIYAILAGTAGRTFKTVEAIATALEIDPFKLIEKD